MKEFRKANETGYEIDCYLIGVHIETLKLIEEDNLELLLRVF